MVAGIEASDLTKSLFEEGFSVVEQKHFLSGQEESAFEELSLGYPSPEENELESDELQVRYFQNRVAQMACSLELRGSYYIMPVCLRNNCTESQISAHHRMASSSAGNTELRSQNVIAANPSYSEILESGRDCQRL
jgi:hypothetical protein